MTNTEIPTYTVRAMADGALLSELRGGDIVSAETAYHALESFYLNVPDSSLASGISLQMFRESDDFVELEVTFP